MPNVPNPPGPDRTNWDNISDVGANPSFPTGEGDLAVVDLGGAIDITASSIGAAEELQIVNSSAVTFSSGQFDVGNDSQGGMLIDESSELIIASSGTMANRGSLDIIGLTGDGTLTIQSGAGFDDLGMIVGADADAHGEVTIDAAFGFIVAQSGSGAATDGVLIVGEDGDGTVDVTDTSVFGSAITILGENDGSTGEVDLNNSSWGGSSLTIGPAGTGIANIGSGSTVLMHDILVGPNGLLNATGAAATPGIVIAPILTLGFGTIDVTGGGEVNVGAVAGSIGAVSIAGTSMTALGTVKGDVVVGVQGTVQATGSAPGALMIDGNVHGTGTIEPLMTLEVNGGIDSGVDIEFSPSIGAQVGDLILDVPAANLGTIVGFGAGNTIDVAGLALHQCGVYPGNIGRRRNADPVGRIISRAVVRGRRHLCGRRFPRDARHDRYDRDAVFRRRYPYCDPRWRGPGGAARSRRRGADVGRRGAIDRVDWRWPSARHTRTAQRGDTGDRAQGRASRQCAVQRPARYQGAFAVHRRRADPGRGAGEPPLDHVG